MQKESDPVGPGLSFDTSRAQAQGHPMLIYWKVFAWIGILGVFGFLIWLLSSMLLPFVIAFVLAYFLDPVVRKLTDLGLRRVWAGILVALVTFGTLLAVLSVAVPFVVLESTALLDALPSSWEEAREQAHTILPAPVADRLDDLDEVAEIGAEGMADALGNAMSNLVLGMSGLVSIVMFWVVMPVVTVYLLIDWPRLIHSADTLLPRPWAPTLRGIARDIDRTLSGYIRGQAIVCSILMGYYALALSLVGLPFAIAVGVVTGAVSFIPYVGMFIGTSLGMGVALWQFWGDPGWVAAVAAIYAFGLLVESEFLVPRLVGDAVNLHPVWLIFAVIAFGTVFGFVGALMAVPLAAMAGVVMRHLIDSYRASALYKGQVGIEGQP